MRDEKLDFIVQTLYTTAGHRRAATRELRELPTADSNESLFIYTDPELGLLFGIVINHYGPHTAVLIAGVDHAFGFQRMMFPSNMRVTKLFGAANLSDLELEYLNFRIRELLVLEITEWRELFW